MKRTLKETAPAHTHEESCTCGHDHGHSHEHGHEHGHDHEHHHEHGESCTCSHEQTHEPPHTAASPQRGHKKQAFLLKNIACAHCAGEMERQISALSDVSACVLSYETKKLHVTAREPRALLPEIQRICASIENGATVALPGDAEAETAGGGHPLLGLLLGAALFTGGMLTAGTVQVGLLLAAYAVLGWRVVWTAAKNLLRGRMFDENFLMSIATIGACLIGDFGEAVGVMLFYRVGEYFEDRAVERSRRQIMDAIDLRPETVQLVENGGVRTISAGEAKVGDLVLVRPGDRVPLDGVVESGESRLDTSAVTGEPVPVRVSAGDEAISGCVNTDGALYLRVKNALSESMVTRILDSVENAAARKPKLDRFITRFSRIYTPVVVLIAVLTALIPGMMTGNWNQWIYTALTFLVISCPCALVLSVPLTYFAGIGAGSRRGILFKGGASLEALAAVKVAVMDKTGTVTHGNFVVQQIFTPSGNENALLALAAACEAASTHPIAKSILAEAAARGVTIPAAADVHETAGEGVQATIGGVRVLCGNAALLARHDVTIADGIPQKHGGTEVLLAANGQFAGWLLISDIIKQDAVEAVARLHKQGLQTAMLTGDGAQSADAVAHAVGIGEVRARLLPADKVSALDSLRQTYGAVLFVGDGINDAPVLAGADVGAAMGTGADAAIEAADVVYMTGALSAVPDSIALARRCGRIATQNIALALGIKALVLALGLAGIASMWLAVFADSGVALLCVLNSVRLLYRKD